MIGLHLRGGAPNPDLFTGDEDEGEDAGKSPEGLYLSNNATGYKGVCKQTNGETFYVRKTIEGFNALIYGFTTAIEAARMYKRIVDGDVTVEEAREEVAKEAWKKKKEAEAKKKKEAVKANLETQKKELEAKLEEIYEKLAALE